MTFPEFKGTNGEWQVHDTYDNYEQYTPDTPQIIVWNGDEQASKPICDMGEMGDFNYAEELANAKLISAAPNLLKALQLALSTPHNEWDATKQQICFDALEKALGTPIVNPRPEGTPDAF